MSNRLKIEVGFDFVCPWCLIGLRNLRVALVLLQAARPEIEVELQWRGVQLLPGIPPRGLPFEEFYRHRLGGEAAMRARQAQVLHAAEAAGVRIVYSAISIMPNTADAHRLLAYAGRLGDPTRCDALLERLLRAYFEDGDDIGNPAVLLAHGEAAGLARPAMQAELRGAETPYRGEGAGSGSSGVPYYVINGGPPITGAQPPDVLLAAMRGTLALHSAPQ
jgi:predicted DsbA family dithiol-disulfide isomerase